MGNDLNEGTDLQQEFENVRDRVVHMRKKYPALCGSYLSSALRKDIDRMMTAEVVPVESSKDEYSAQYVDQTKLEKLNLTTKLEPFTDKVKDIDLEILDIRAALKQIRAARHKNVEE